MGTYLEKYKSKCRIDIDKGWEDIIEKFLQDFEKLNKNEEIHINQIKQKLGELRIYFSGLNKEESETAAKMRMLVDKTERLCNATCEMCKTMENVTFRRPRFWIFKICEKCYDEWCDKMLVEDREKGRDVSHIFAYHEEEMELIKIRRKIQELRNKVEFELNFFYKQPKKVIEEYTKKFQYLTSQLECDPKKIRNVDILNDHTRIVVGAHGPYVEIQKNHFAFDPVLEQSERWRVLLSLKNCKYVWMTHPRLGIKIYYQLKKVKYADYKPGYYYIDLLMFDGLKCKKKNLI